MRDWKAHHRQRYLRRIVNLEAFPSASSLCNRCKLSPGLFRCNHCTGRALWCEQCCLAIHQTSPFHQPKKWNGRCFRKVDLDKMGLTIYLGHSGDPCPLLSDHRAVPLHTPDRDGDIDMEDLNDMAWVDEDRPAFVGDRMRIVDTTGIFSRRVRWCCCPDEDGNPVPFDLQLLDAEIYPATSDRPSTAFTFNVLDEFAMDALECKTAALTFLSKLRRLTDPVFPLATPVRLYGTQ
jgi:CxC2 like cysteine cluster associated with KDZ transposases